MSAVLLWTVACDSRSNSSGASDSQPQQNEISSMKAYFFFSDGCPHCHEALAYIKKNHPNAKLQMENVANPQSYKLFIKCAQKFNLGNRIGTPLFCLGNNYLMGWAPEYESKFDQYIQPYLDK